MSVHPSPVRTGLACRCPRCGEGRLFKGYLTVREKCEVCGLDFSRADSGDGPAIFIILIAGAIVGAAVLYVELAWQPAYWVHGLVALVLGVGLPLALLRPFKGVMIALQYRHGAAEGRLDE